MIHALFLRGLAAAVLLLASGCRPGGAPRIYAPWETGLTLAYEDPRLPAEQRMAKRIQLRVSRADRAPEGHLLVEHTLTTLQGQGFVQSLLKNGGIFRLDPSGKGAYLALPEGFPERMDRWQVVDDQGLYRRMTFLGRAVASLPGIKLPETSDAVGLWLESEWIEKDGRIRRLRSLLLQDLGEVETWILEDDSRRWVCVNRLVARGFTDLPAPKAK